MINNPSSKLMLTIAVLAATATLKAQEQPSDAIASSSVKVAASADENYRLCPNDLIYVKVYQEDDLNSTLRISEDGTIIFPLIGSVKVGGANVQGATKIIRDRLDKRFLIDPQLTVTVLGFANRNVTVLGQVQRPGSYSMKDQNSFDLLQAVGLAGGFTRMANSTKITVKRSVSGREVVMVLDGKKLAHDSDATPFTVLPGDTITVAERFF